MVTGDWLDGNNLGCWPAAAVVLVVVVVDVVVVLASGVDVDENGKCEVVVVDDGERVGSCPALLEVKRACCCWSAASAEATVDIDANVVEATVAADVCGS